MSGVPPNRTAGNLYPAAESQWTGLPLRIQLLGRFLVSHAGRAVDESEWRLRKAQSLIKLLALAPGHRLYRSRCIEQLWPDLSVNAAANNLHFALHVARATLAQLWAPLPAPGAILRLRQQVLTFEPQIALLVDLDAYEAAAPQALRTRDVTCIETAAALYAGELLPGDRYEDWTTGRRDAVDQTQLRLLFTLAELYHAQNQHESATEAYERVLAIEPADEEAHLALMRLYAEVGQRHLAIRQYGRLREALARELDTAPSRDSQHLYRAMLTGHLGSSLFPLRNEPDVCSP